MSGDPFYGTAAWKRLRAAVLERDPICTACGAAPSTDADHITPRRVGGADSMANCRGLCGDCHRSRRGGAGAVRPRGCDAAGRPRDPGHWWNSGENLSGLGGSTARGDTREVSFKTVRSGRRR